MPLPNMPFRLDADFAPVIKISTSYNVLVTNPSVPANSVSELVTLLKSQPDKLGVIGNLHREHTSAARLERPPSPEDNAARIGIAGRDALRIKVAPLMPTGG